MKRKPPKVRYLVGDARDVLRRRPEKSVQTIVTSPPYFGLRDYDIPPSIWGGNKACQHEWTEEEYKRRSNDGGKTPKQLSNRGANRRDISIHHGYCVHCGAWFGCLGLEPTIELYIEHVLEVGREAWRVLRDDGIMWWNQGDSYNNRSVARPSSHQGGLGFTNESIERSWADQSKLGLTRLSISSSGLKEKDKILMPFRIALAFQQDGWCVRQDNNAVILWIKPNSMPESVKDRPTTSHEYIFMMTKSNKPTYWVNMHRGIGSRTKPDPDYLYVDLKNNVTYETEPKEFRSGDKSRWRKENQWRARDYFYDYFAAREPSTERPSGNVERFVASEGEKNRLNTHLGSSIPYEPDGTGRNRRSVWIIPVEALPDEHYAAFPREIPRIAILSGSSSRACPKCGAPWERVLERTYVSIPSEEYNGKWKGTDVQSSGRRMRLNVKARRLSGEDHDNPFPLPVHVGWQPTCACSGNDGSARCVVLDPFAGSGTTLLEGHELGRDAIGIDISKKYAEMADRRIRRGGGHEHELEEFK